MTDMIKAPWTPAQVDALNRFQRLGFVHPFTCQHSHDDASRDLVATKDGWICPHCDYQQDWAHEAMLHVTEDSNPLAVTRIPELIARLEKATGPDRALDAEIAAALGITWSADEDGQFGGYGLLPRRVRFTEELSAACSLLPWKDHPGSTFTLKIIQNGRGFYCYAEFTWPSTECQGWGHTESIAVCIAALRAIKRTRADMAPYRKPKENDHAK